MIVFAEPLKHIADDPNTKTDSFSHFMFPKWKNKLCSTFFGEWSRFANGNQLRETSLFCSPVVTLCDFPRLLRVGVALLWLITICSTSVSSPDQSKCNETFSCPRTSTRNVSIGFDHDSIEIGWKSVRSVGVVVRAHNACQNRCQRWATGPEEECAGELFI